MSIDLAALATNLALVKARAPTSKVICCVKANAYGHGMVEVAGVLAAEADALAVASIDEARILREAGITAPILLLEGFFESSELVAVEALDLWSVVHNRNQLDALQQTRLQRPIDVWLKLDTGMHRLGFPTDEAASVFAELSNLEQVNKVRLMTHFACADELDNDFTALQIDRFNQAVQALGAERSLANSAAILGWPAARADWVRPGYMLYGLSPFGQQHQSAHQLTPVMTFESQIIEIKQVARGEGIGYNHAWRAQRETRIAVVAAGYGDGYPRNTKNGAPVLVQGQRAKTLGHIAMDMMMVDISAIPSATIGSPVELWGKQLSVNEVAAYSGYSPYELLTRMPSRATVCYNP